MRRALLLGWPLFACGAPAGPSPAELPAEAPVQPDPPSTGPVVARAMDPNAPVVCTALLRMGLVSGPGPGCAFASTPSRQRGSLQYACKDGDVTGAFGTARFAGRVSEGRVHLEARRELDGPDGCRWESVQTIDGSLDHSVLEFSVRERAIAGTGCAPSCIGGAPVRIER